MDEQMREKFESVAYAYRSWPMTDQTGVIKRFDELVGFVDALISIETLFQPAAQGGGERDSVQAPLTDEQIDKLAEAMPGGVLGVFKDWGYRQFARSILALRAMPTWEPEFCGDGEQIELAEKFCLEIAGRRGQKGSPPDPVRLLEMALELYQAEREVAPKATP